MKESVHLVYVTDAGYLMPTAVSLASAYAWCNAPARLVAHILDVGVADDVWKEWERRLRSRLPAEAKIHRHRLPEKALDGFPAYLGNPAACARVYMPSILSGLDWCFYVDGDTMFFDDPLNAAHVYDANYAYQVHRDRLENKQDEDRHRRWFEKYGLSWDVEQYGCTGVMLVNLKWFRLHEVERKAIDFLKSHLDTMWVDQDALYWVCRGHVKFLPDEWGMMDDHLCLSVGTVPSCLHYVQRKPWKMDPISRGYLSDADVAWADCASLLTDYRFPRKRFANCWRAFLKTIAVIARLNAHWRESHEYILMWMLPRFMFHHISGQRLRSRLRSCL